LKLSINYIIYTYLYTLVSNTFKDLDTVRKIISNILEIMFTIFTIADILKKVLFNLLRRQTHVLKDLE